MHRGPEGLSRGFERARLRLRLSRRVRRQTVEHEERVHRQRAVPAQRPARPADLGLRRQNDHPSRRWPREFHIAADHSAAQGGAHEGRQTGARRDEEEAAISDSTEIKLSREAERCTSSVSNANRSGIQNITSRRFSAPRRTAISPSPAGNRDRSAPTTAIHTRLRYISAFQAAAPCAPRAERYL